MVQLEVRRSGMKVRRWRCGPYVWKPLHVALDAGGVWLVGEAIVCCELIGSCVRTRMRAGGDGH